MSTEATTVHARVCFVITGLHLGGAETQLVRLAIALRQRNWDISIVSMLAANAFAESTSSHGIPVHALGCRRGVPDPRALLRLARQLRSFSPDIVHSFMIHANILARISRLLYWAPVHISSARSVDEGGHLRMLGYRVTDPLCDLTTQVSLAGLRRYVELGAVPARKILYVPNGVDTTVFRPNAHAREETRNSFGLRDEFVWLAVGRCEAVKNYPLLLRAFAAASQGSPEVVLLIAGNGSCQTKLRCCAEALGLRNSVRFLGQRNDISALMNAADGYVLTSDCEGIPNSLLEALASGLPSVATAVGGVPDVLTDGKTGVLVRPGDQSEVAAGLRRVMSLTPAERSGMGSYARHDMCKRFGLFAVTEVWEGIYETLIARRRGRPGLAGRDAAIRSICKRLEPKDDRQGSSLGNDCALGTPH